MRIAVQSGYPGRRNWFYSLILAVLFLTACGNAAANGVTPSASPASSPSPTLTTTAAATGSPTATLTSTPAPTGTSTVALTATPQPTVTGAATPAVTFNEEDGGSGGRNEVRVVNKTDRTLKVRGRIQLNKIPGSTATPSNLAYAYSSCTDCQTIAVALQINLISKQARTIAPQNVALAINERCTRCVTVARAIQYNIQVDNPNQEPEEVRDLIKEMNKTLQEISSDKSLTLPQAESRINAVIAQFQNLTASLSNQRDEDDKDDGKPTPTPSTTVTTTPTGTATPTSTTTPQSTASPAPSPSPSPSRTP